MNEHLTHASVFIVISILYFGFSEVAFSKAYNITDIDNAFAIHAYFTNYSSKNDRWNNINHIFVVDVDVKNIGTMDAQIVYWVVGQSSWVTDNDNLIPAHYVQQDERDQLSLRPGEVYHWKVRIKDLRAGISGSPVTFRLGFLPNSEQPLASMPISSFSVEEITRRGGITWSNEITYLVDSRQGPP